jgi:hypothetical protein
MFGNQAKDITNAAKKASKMKMNFKSKHRSRKENERKQHLYELTRIF